MTHKKDFVSKITMWSQDPRAPHPEDPAFRVGYFTSKTQVAFWGLAIPVVLSFVFLVQYLTVDDWDRSHDPLSWAVVNAAPSAVAWLLCGYWTIGRMLWVNNPRLAQTLNAICIGLMVARSTHNRRSMNQNSAVQRREWEKQRQQEQFLAAQRDAFEQALGKQQQIASTQHPWGEAHSILGGQPHSHTQDAW